MKKFILMLIAVAFAAAVVAQSKEAKPMAKPMPAKEKTVKQDAGVKEEKPAASEVKEEKAHHNKYECPKCHMHAEKPGKCSHCKVEMIEAKAEMKKEKAEMKEHKHEHDHGNGHDHNHDHGKKAE